jgi:hypothetical protein
MSRRINRQPKRRSRSSSSSSSSSILLPTLLLLSSCWFPTVSTTDTTSDTSSSNPFFNGGCLYQRKANWTKLRVCGSEDSPDAAEMGYCLAATDFEYMEIRIHGQNWEAAIFQTWILQILLSEVLQVPTSVETSLEDTKINFYNADSRFEYGDSDDWGCLQRGVQIGDCRRLDDDDDDDSNTSNESSSSSYQSCCHFIPEVWPGTLDTFEELQDAKTIEPALPMGTIGEEHWFIPKFTAVRDPTLLSYIGMAGEDNRRKLADRFQRPTTWRDYCNEVSLTKCRGTDNTTADTNDTIIAVRPPRDDEADAERFFVEGLYQGHFRKIIKNDCTANNCTGHIFNYPCTWESYVIPQAYHLGIAVAGDGVGQGETGGYAYGDLVDALLAANATKSDILILWWTPEAVRCAPNEIRMRPVHSRGTRRRCFSSYFVLLFVFISFSALSRIHWYRYGIDQSYVTSGESGMLRK